MFQLTSVRFWHNWVFVEQQPWPQTFLSIWRASCSVRFTLSWLPIGSCYVWKGLPCFYARVTVVRRHFRWFHWYLDKLCCSKVISSVLSLWLIGIQYGYLSVCFLNYETSTHFRVDLLCRGVYWLAITSPLTAIDPLEPSRAVVLSRRASSWQGVLHSHHCCSVRRHNELLSRFRVILWQEEFSRSRDYDG